MENPSEPPSRAAEFAPRPSDLVYLDTASCGLGPARAAAAMRQAVDDWHTGDFSSFDPAVADARAAFACIASVPPEHVAVGASASVQVALVAGALPPGAEVLVADGDFSSLVNPFAVRADLKLRAVPLEALPGEVRPGTALVAVSSVQSADGRLADLDAIRAAAAAHGARLLVDATQSVRWLPLAAGRLAYVVCAAFKWLLCPRGVSFLTVADPDSLTPFQAGWRAGEVPFDSCYGPIAQLAESARRFDTSPAYLPYIGAARSLQLVEEIGVAAIGAHDLALAGRFRDGLARLGYTPLGSGGSPIVSVPGLGDAAGPLREAGIEVSSRAGNLRASFHLYNTAAEVDRLLEVLGDVRRG